MFPFELSVSPYKTHFQFQFQDRENIEIRRNDPVERMKSFKNDEEEVEGEVWSFCDQPIISDESKKVSPELINNYIIASEKDFNFCSSWNDLKSNESEMFAADDVFFQGQILLMHYSISSKSGLIVELQSDTRTTSARPNKYKPRQNIPNQFQYSFPSPKPRIRSSKNKNENNGKISNRKSVLWSIFRVGLVTIPEISLRELKFRTNSKISSDSLSSKSSTSSNRIASSQTKADQKEEINKKHVSRRSTGGNFEVYADDEDMKNLMRTRKQQQHQQKAGNQAALSRNRTFERLNRLTVKAAALVTFCPAGIAFL